LVARFVPPHLAGPLCFPPIILTNISVAESRAEAQERAVQYLT